MKKSIAFIHMVFFSFFMLSPNIVFSTTALMEGLWELKGEIKIEGATIASIPINSSKCITINSMIPQQLNDKHCSIISKNNEENAISWTIICKDESGLVTEKTVSLTFQKDTFDENIRNVIVNSKGVKTITSIHILGQRIGDCK